MQEPTAFRFDAATSRVKVLGEIDILSAPVLIDAVLQSAASELDLSEVSFMDSKGLQALLDLRRTRPSLRIVASSPPVQRVIQLTGLVEHLDVEIDA